ncbi:hypothetical protein [Streptomyces sp. NPDC051079]|uniref:hypothetical protein n=1 Tax=Streptomyces sp. NPDC051079 TaxID=3155043 RepID=UPI00344C3091
MGLEGAPWASGTTGGARSRQTDGARLRPHLPEVALCLLLSPLAAYTVRLADRIERHVSAGDFVLVLGGDCSAGRSAP